MSVQATHIEVNNQEVLSFNTSYVSVQAKNTRQQFGNFSVSIHPMCRFKIIIDYIDVLNNVKFQYILCVGSSPFLGRGARIYCRVSIHPMCRFKAGIKHHIIITFKVSIHPMCRFKKQHLLLWLFLEVVSIHPMCRFKSHNIGNSGAVSVFQYILCVGSRNSEIKSFSLSKEFQYILCVGSSFKLHLEG